MCGHWEMKSLLEKYQKISSKDSQETPNSTFTPTTNQISQFYSTFDRIWNENQQNSIDSRQSQSSRSENQSSFQSFGLLFIIIDDLPHELIWRAWLKSSHSSFTPIQIFIHAKFPERIRSPWVKSHLVSFHYFPEWGSIEITKVMVHLLREAVASSETITHLCFVSESCLPAVSLDTAITMIQNDNTSWIKWKLQANNGYSTQEQFSPLSRSIPKECIFKSDQWVLLLRIHAEKILTLIDSLPFDAFKPFQNVRASDEMFIPTCLGLLNFVSKQSQQNSSPPSLSTSKKSDLRLVFNTTEFSSRRVTYCQWSSLNAKSPTTFPHLFSALLTDEQSDLTLNSRNTNVTVSQEATQEGCIFLRKIMNPRIKYPFEAETRSNLSDRLDDLWRSRQEFLREWCDLVLHVALDDQVVEEKEVDEEAKKINVLEIQSVVKVVEDDNRVYALQFAETKTQERNQRHDRSRSPQSRFRRRSRSRESSNRYQRRSRSRERYDGPGRREGNYRDRR